MAVSILKGRMRKQERDTDSTKKAGLEGRANAEDETPSGNYASHPPPQHRPLSEHVNSGCSKESNLVLAMFSC